MSSPGLVFRHICETHTQVHIFKYSSVHKYMRGRERERNRLGWGMERMREKWLLACPLLSKKIVFLAGW